MKRLFIHAAAPFHQLLISQVTANAVISVVQ